MSFGGGLNEIRTILTRRVVMDIDSIIMTIVTVGLGVSVVWVKAERVIKALKELADVLTAISSALSDKKLTEEEIDNIKVEAKEALSAFRAILK